MKKKLGRPPKKKNIDSFVEVKEKPVVDESKLCECGNPVHPGTSQCWACSHRV